MRRKTLILLMVLSILLCACSNAKGEVSGENLASRFASFTVTSDSLKGTVWKDVISKTDKGSNASPQLSWEPVDGASEYIIYMVDTSAQYWMHWKSEGITETELPEGYASAKEYVGPYPPEGGKHTYDIYVIAIKKPLERVKGGLDGQNLKFADFIEAADTDAEGNTGNIVACGHLSGTFKN